VLLGIAALTLLVWTRLMRFGDPARTLPSSALTTAFAAEFALVLRRDAAALIGYAMGQGGAQNAPSDGEAAARLKAITTLVARRGEDADANTTLDRVREGLGIAGGSDEPPEEFVWRDEHAERYRAIGTVKSGQTVLVMKSPVIAREADGSTRVVERGHVMAKR
jgi:hypothetical protein